MVLQDNLHSAYEKTWWSSSHWFTRGLSFPAIKTLSKRQHLSYVRIQAHIEPAILDHSYNYLVKNKQLDVCCTCLLNVHVYVSSKARYSIVFLKGRSHGQLNPY